MRCKSLLQYNIRLYMLFNLIGRFNSGSIYYLRNKNLVALNNVLPLKFRKVNLSSFFYSKIKVWRSNFEKLVFVQREIKFLRYINYFIVSFVSSKLFVNKVKVKIINFLRSNLLFHDCLVVFCSRFQSGFIFLGYNFFTCVWFNIHL